MIHLPGRLSYSRSRETLARSQVLRRTWPIMLDLFVAAIGLACFYGVVRIATLWMGHAEPQMVISLAPGSLPKYAFFSIVRMSLAYFLSLAFAITYGYIAAYSQRFESLMIAGLDILQSIPVLSFLPGVMLAMVALFPTRQVGVELGAIILIFTGQAWNIAFSFYSSLKSLPKELQEADGLRCRRMVLPHGLRNVRSRDARLPSPRTRKLSANSRQPGKLSSHALGHRHHDRHRRRNRPDDMATDDRL